MDCKCVHECGLCDGPLVYDGTTGGYDTWVCMDPECGWWHIAKDCCAEDAQ